MKKLALSFVALLIFVPFVSYAAPLTQTQAESLIGVVQASPGTPASAFTNLITAFSNITVAQAESLIGVVQAAPGVAANAFVSLLVSFTQDTQQTSVNVPQVVINTPSVTVNNPQVPAQPQPSQQPIPTSVPAQTPNQSSTTCDDSPQLSITPYTVDNQNTVTSILSTPVLAPRVNPQQVVTGFENGVPFGSGFDANGQPYMSIPADATQVQYGTQYTAGSVFFNVKVASACPNSHWSVSAGHQFGNHPFTWDVINAPSIESIPVVGQRLYGGLSTTWTSEMPGGWGEIAVASSSTPNGSLNSIENLPTSVSATATFVATDGATTATTTVPVTLQ